MIKFARINNPTKHTCDVALGNSSAADVYKSMGMTEMDVEQSDIDGQWYEAGYAPMKSKKQKETEAEAEALAAAKAERAAAVAAITVTVDGMVFDGDEKAQERMARAVSMADSLEEETEWVLHDSTVAIVTAAQLRRACRAAGKAQTALWVKPYTS